MVVEFVVIFISGVLIGCAIASAIFRLKTDKVDGILNIDRSDPDDGPYPFLELTKSLNDLSRKKYVTFKVENKNYISPK